MKPKTAKGMFGEYVIPDSLRRKTKFNIDGHPDRRTIGAFDFHCWLVSKDARSYKK